MRTFLTILSASVLHLAPVAQANTANTKAEIIADAQKIDDAGLLSRLNAGNLEEIRLATLAAEKSQNKIVLALAQKLIKDHTAANQLVQSVAQKASLQVGTVVAVSDNETRRMKDTQEIGEVLAKATGKDFDKNFILAMIRSHQHTVVLLSSVKSKSDDVKALNKTLLPVVRGHLALLMRIAGPH